MRESIKININELMTAEAIKEVSECEWSNQVDPDEHFKPEHKVLGTVYRGSEHFTAILLKVFEYQGELVGIYTQENSEESFNPELGEEVTLIPMKETVGYEKAE